VLGGPLTSRGWRWLRGCARTGSGSPTRTARRSGVASVCRRGRNRPRAPVAAGHCSQDPIRPVQAAPRVPAPRHRDFVTQHEYVGVLRRVGASQQHQPADGPGEDQAGRRSETSHDHPLPSAPRLSAQVTATNRLLAPRRATVHCWKRDDRQRLRCTTMDRSVVCPVPLRGRTGL
jgi:hypothetical protein